MFSDHAPTRDRPDCSAEAHVLARNSGVLWCFQRRDHVHISGVLTLECYEHEHKCFLPSRSMHQSLAEDRTRLIVSVDFTVGRRYDSNRCPDDHTRSPSHAPVQGAANALEHEA